MPLINIIAERREQQVRLQRNRQRLLLLLMLEVALLGGLFSFFAMSTLSLQSRLQRAQREIKQLEPTLQRIEQIERETQALMPRIRTLAEAQQRTHLWHQTIAGIARSLPDNVWLTGITSTQSQATDKENSATLITLTGSALSQQQVGELMLRLNAFPAFEQVDLHYTQQRTYNQLESVDFEIAVRLQASQGKEDSNESNRS